MESACESGKLTANIILNKYNKEKAYLYNHKKPIYFTIFEKLDDILFENNLPSIIFLVIIIIIFIFYKFYY